MKKTSAYTLLYIVGLIGLYGLFASCRENKTTEAEEALVEDSLTLVMQVARTSRLYTAEYRIHKIVTHEDVQRMRAVVFGKEVEAPVTLGDRKVAIPIDVTLRAYVDFSNFSDENIDHSPDGRIIHVTLPDPHIVVTSSKVDHAGTKQYVDLFRSRFSDAELTSFTDQGVQQVLHSIPEIGLLYTAQQSAAATLIPLIASMGYEQENIVISFRKDFTAADLPALYDNEQSVVRLTHP